MKTLISILAIFLVTITSCNQANVKETEQTVPSAPIEITYHIEGMTCTDCENSIKKGVNELEGIVSVEASFEDSVAHLVYDQSKTNEEEIIAAIEKRGYSVVNN